MIYYSTGKSPYMRSVGKAVEVDDKTAEILLKQGYIVKEKVESNVVVKDIEEVISEPQTEVKKVAKPVNEVAKQQKPKGRPSKK